ncbi:MAG: glucosamine-6-phosphate deaminase [Anaerorhabdus sp.]
MKVIVVENYEELSKEAFKVMKEVVVSKEVPVLGLATGSSPCGLYKEMIADHQENGTSYRNVVTFNLDEYIGLPKNHEQTYYTFMHENLFNGLDILEENVHLPVGDSSQVELECEKYEEAMKEVQIDIQLLGIGANGHIGFNEPGTSFDSVTHIVDLKEKTREDNARFFGSLEEVPTKAITMGIATILRSKKILLVASGENKADAIYEMVQGKVSEDCPATALRQHPDVVVIVDVAAAKKLS